MILVAFVALGFMLSIHGVTTNVEETTNRDASNPDDDLTSEWEDKASSLKSEKKEVEIEAKAANDKSAVKDALAREAEVEEEDTAVKMKGDDIDHGEGPSSARKSPSYDLGKRQSFGFFDDIEDNNWNILQNITANMANHRDRQDPLKPLPFDREPKNWAKYFTWYQKNYEPNFSCAYERRVGGNGNGDGPKWVCDPHRIARRAKERKAKDPSKPGCIIYSVGSNCDFQFELGMQEAVGVGVCEYHTFDMGNYEHCMPKELQNAHYHRWGIVKQKKHPNLLSKKHPQGWTMHGLKDTIKMLGHDTLDAIDVFKIDCEGCEWTSFDDWLDPEMPDLMQILVEIHKPPRSMALKFFDMLHEAGYVRFHKEPNIQYHFGGAIEYAFLKLSKDYFIGGDKVGKRM